LRTTPSNRSILVSTGPFSSIKPGDSINVTFAIVCAKKYGFDLPRFDTPEQRRNFVLNATWAQRAYNGEDRNGNGILEPNEDLNKDGKITRYILPTPPNSPIVKVVPENQKVTIYWDKSAENSVDPITGKKDFEGYKIYRTNLGADLTQAQDLSRLFILSAEFDSVGNDIGYNTGFNFIRLSEPKTFPNDTNKYYYRFEFDNLLNGWQYVFSVTAFDKGDVENNLEILEISPLVNAVRVVPGTPAASSDDVEVGVYPNPYYAKAIWDGSSERQRKIYFYNLPQECDITIYTLSGDIVATLHHDKNYNASDIQWFQTYSKEGKQILSGGEHAWDLITKNDQAIATGLYLFTVKDKANGKIKRGKFLVIK
ncbi:MAG: hypothetical protein N3A61_00820, partial [Ignavibacteria bacterium]|nr:hypothetical protein [Ignavibacteria bacterium]